MPSPYTILTWVILTIIASEIGPAIGGSLGTTVSLMGLLFALMTLKIGIAALARALTNPSRNDL